MKKIKSYICLEPKPKPKPKLKSYYFFPAKLAPFNIRFVSDNYESVAESMNNPDGFELAYILRPCS